MPARRVWVHTTNGNTIGFLMGNPGHEVHHEVDAVGCLLDPDVAEHAMANYPIAKGKGVDPEPASASHEEAHGEAEETHDVHDTHEDTSEDHDTGESHDGTEGGMENGTGDEESGE